MNGFIYLGSDQHREFREYDHTYAMDFNLPLGQDTAKNVYAAATGKIVHIDRNLGFIVVEHGAEGIKWYTEYMHLQLDPQIYFAYQAGHDITVVGGETVLGSISYKDKHLHFVISRPYF